MVLLRRSGWLLPLAVAGMAAAQSPTAVEFFERRIRPVLAQDCYECHDSRGTRKGGLALDHRAAVVAGGSSGPVVVPGDPAGSRLWQAIARTSPHLQMPKGRPALSAAVVADFATWIRDGAVDPRTAPPTEAERAADTDWSAVMARRLSWWSFQPLAADAPPGAGHPVDAFLDRDLAAAGLAPTPPAGRPALIRRLSLLLRGLPPTPAEVDAFVADADPRAFERLVDRWLPTVEFGERWARHWMDWLRYADSHGSEGDPAIPYAWRYRDHLIAALAADVPFDQLLREHLAGDLLPQRRIDPATGIDQSALGTAHLRMVFHGYAPTEPLEELVRFTDDQIDVVGKAFLGLTVACARCHDHKFDPISQRDYTALFGVFTSCVPAIVAVDAADARVAATRQQLRASKERLRLGLAEAFAARAPGLAARLSVPDAAMQAAIAQASAPTELLHGFWLLQRGDAAALAAWLQPPAAAPSSATWSHTLGRADDLAQWRRSGAAVQEPARAGEFVVATTGPRALAGILPACVASHPWSDRDRGVLVSPKVALVGEQEAWALVAGAGGAALRYVVQHYPRDGSVYPVHGLEGGHWRWVRMPLGYWQGERIHFELATAADQPVLARPDVERSWFAARTVFVQPAGAPAPPPPGEFVQPVAAAAGGLPASAAELAAAFATALRAAAAAWRDGQLSDAQAMFLEALRRLELLPDLVDEAGSLADELAAHRRLAASLPVPTRAPGVLEVEPVAAPLFLRGNSRQPGEAVPRRGLAAFGGAPYPADASGRLQLAEELARPGHPLVRRVFVNRIWQQVFGRGLVATPDDFGHMGQPPTHPGLLDWLARWSGDQGGSIHALVRLLVTSAAWQRDSTPSAEARRLDPDNRLWSHMPVRRLEAEAIRDAMLAVAGELDRTCGGPPVSGEVPRRSVYVRQQRNAPDPFLAVFDAPVPASCKGRRDATNVPAQALTLLNGAFAAGLAERWAGRVVDDGLGPDARVEAMYRQALGRRPDAAERQRAAAFVRESAAARAVDRTQREQLTAAVARHEQARAGLLAAAQQRVLAGRADGRGGAAPLAAAAWTFGGGAGAGAAALPLTLHGSARVVDGALVVGGPPDHAASAPLPFPLLAKTLMAWVQLDDLDQQGGGVLSVQTLDGQVFDAIVFGERRAGHWLAGSDGFARTQDLDGPPETAATRAPVHVAITWAADGTIAVYRDGQPHGRPYRSRGPVAFAAGQAQVLFGHRHGAPGGNRHLRGRIQRAAVFDRALTAAEIAACMRASDGLCTTAEILAAMTQAEREQELACGSAIAAAHAGMAALDRQPGLSSAWADLALCLFNLEEFRYLR